MHIVEQEQDRVQSIILFRLALFTSTEDHNSSKINRQHHANCTIVARITGSGVENSYKCHITFKQNILGSYREMWHAISIIIVWFTNTEQSLNQSRKLADTVNNY